MSSIMFKLSYRKLMRNKIYSVANVLGLTVGFASFILIALFIQYEFNWDKHNDNYNQIYRLQRYVTNALYAQAGNNISPHTRAITAELIEGKYPEFEKLTVTREQPVTFLGTDDEHLVNEKSGIAADTHFFDVFTYQFIAGDKTAALSRPYSIVLSETLAQKLFNKSNVLNQTVMLEKKVPLLVTGIYKDLPYNSSVRPPFILSFSTLKPLYNIERSSLWAGNCMTFAKLRSGADPQVAGDKIKNLFAEYDDIKYIEMQLCPLSKVYLNFNDRNDYLIVLKLFGLIGVFILVMSGFNYINLSLAQASMRGKEVALKKVIGSRKRTLITQFLGETITVSVISLLLALLLAYLFLPFFNSVVDKHLSLSLLYNIKFGLLLIFVAVLTGLLSGIYPAVFMASNKISTLFKENFLGKERQSFSLKKALITLQFAISLFLIVLTVSFSMQIKYISEKDIGFEKQGLLYSQINISDDNVSFNQLRDRLLKHPDITDVSLSKNFPFVRQGGGTTNWEGGNRDEKITCRFNEVSYNYLSMLETNLVTGRNFSSSFTGDIGKNCIINESAAKCFGWDNPIGKHIKDNSLTIVGVVKDFVYKDMHNPVDPGVYLLAPDKVSGDWILSFRINERNEAIVKTMLAEELKATFPKDPFEISNFSLAFAGENAYRIYQSLNKSLLFFTLLNVLLAIVGVFGLVAFTVARRTKEIGIRKINGSSPSSIFNLLNREYHLLILFGAIIAFPTAWLVYMSIPSANKYSVQPWIFISSIVVLFLIVLVSTSYLTIKAATRNPIEALRYE
ncbi:ABC transporter permease [uncultured Draconibacterium sp.]|uniref:ABC transporter permease n=1 Tax=uncultured Draconibacterium sp. TaxID=1573823 RepID=UPI002AA6BB53|nr:ABC transporter permease [uncultured Draconibacterium sp.]